MNALTASRWRPSRPPLQARDKLIDRAVGCLFLHHLGDDPLQFFFLIARLACSDVGTKMLVLHCDDVVEVEIEPALLLLDQNGRVRLERVPNAQLVESVGVAGRQIGDD